MQCSDTPINTPAPHNTPTSTMTTKDQERAALAQIKAILDTLEPDSYVATAFSGCVELAEENIANDWLQSWPEIAESRLLTEEEKSVCLDALASESKRILNKIAEEAEKIVKYADDPTGCPFSFARLAHRENTKKLARLNAASQSLAKVRTAK